MRADTLWTNARLLTMAPGSPVAAEPGAIAAKDGRIVHIGGGHIDAEQVLDCEGRLVTPGLIDCHTHLVYAGNRAAEFEARLKGVSYEEIARAGGGIVSTMRHTRAASETELVEQALPRLDALIAEGVTTIEIKSGYGLDLESERKMLVAARALGQRRPVRVATTFLGAHALPPEFAGRAQE
jgi:imidazolonepropionase